MRRAWFAAGIAAAVVSYLLLAGSAEGSDQGGRPSSKFERVGLSGPPKSFEAPLVTPRCPCASDSGVVAPEFGGEVPSCPGTTSTSEIRSTLVDAQVLSKYKAFRDSLTTP